MKIDYLFKLYPYIIAQLQKAKNAFEANSRIFFNKTLTPKIKIICYLLLIRPLLTYASPIWWNTSASTFEKLRKFERHSLRVCLHFFRDQESKKLFSNQKLHDKAIIPRIDNFIIKINRDYFANLKNINDKYLTNYSNSGPANYKNEMSTGYLPPPIIYVFR